MTNNKFILLLIGIFILADSLFAQTRVIKVNALKANDYGVRYMLPKTLLKVNIEYTETKQKAGTYAKYASRYLGINDSEIIMEDRTFFTLDNISVTETSMPDKEQSYLVSFKTKTISPFVYLTEDGVICTINAEYTPEEPVRKRPAAYDPPSNSPAISPQSIYTEEYLRAGSVSKMAEVAAKNIYKIRESRQDLLTGEIENVPKDGEAMKIILGNLDAQEKLWTELFTGSGETAKHSKQIEIEPDRELNKEIFFRFSKYLGVVDMDDLSGKPIYFNLRDLKTVEIAEETDSKKKIKETESIVYNVPGKAELEIYNGTKKMYSATITVTQFGTTQILAPSLLDDKKTPVQVYFYPGTGAIKQIIQ
jgi:hypothetical protein